MGLDLLPAAWSPGLISLDEGGWLSQEWSQETEPTSPKGNYPPQPQLLGQDDGYWPRGSLLPKNIALNPPVPYLQPQSRSSTFCFR